MSADFTKMEKEKEQCRSVIRFLFLEGKSRSEIKERLDAVYGDSSPSMATVKNRFNKFQRGRPSVLMSHARVPRKKIFFLFLLLWKMCHSNIIGTTKLV